MANIALLSPHVADLIAAGEVVERPASVAKELIENAVDAGAKTIAVEISHGGLTFLRVTDDGGGIAGDELPTAFLRHATSKLRRAEDLEAIGTLGFRGEALAAIAAVSRVQVLSRTPDCSLGASISLEAGVPGPVEEAGCPLGTTVVVRDLFYNTPARLKFMKKDAYEGAAVFAAVQRLALSHPEVSVRFLRDGKQELLTPGDGQLQSAVYAVLGRELALGFQPVKGSGEDMTVTGFCSLPACCRSSRSYQHFFVNGRYVKSPLMTAALEEAYNNQKMVGRFPGCVLHLEVRPAAVDVNVHPAKTEVKFGAERAVFSAVHHAVQAALEGRNPRPAAPVEKLRPHDTVTQNQLRVSAPFSRREPLTVNVFAPRPAPAAPAVPLRGDSTGPVELPCLPAEEPSAPARPVSAPPAPMEPLPVTKPPDEALPAGVEPDVPQPPSWRVAGEVLDTYIIVEQGDTILLIDKHAAHERLNFDRMKAEGYTPMSQALLTPLAVKLPAPELAALLEHLPLLEEFGFQAEDFGGALLVRQAPFDVDAGEIEPVLLELADTLLRTGRADPAAARDGLLHTMACKAAVKGGWKSGGIELERLAQAVVTGQVKYCPHGRPVAIEMTKYQLERQFGRA